jgi:sugar phosphate permease
LPTKTLGAGVVRIDGDVLTGQLAQSYGWSFAVRFWAGCAVAGALVIACLWNTERRAKSATTADI